MASLDVLHVLGNEYNPEILQATNEPRSAQDLSEELDVPIATCYRRIDELTDANLLELHDRPRGEQKPRDHQKPPNQGRKPPGWGGTG
ncbi:MAG: helix-turn-helix domain-containing protein, partial [Halobacteriales archaeon]|nr:helix-turn-helix domain-containing protein [Halobacteriales archaeon]